MWYRLAQYILKSIIVVSAKYKVMDKIYRWSSNLFMEIIMREITMLRKKFTDQERKAEEIRDSAIAAQLKDEEPDK